MDCYKKENDVSRYLKTRKGERFVVVNDMKNSYVGLFDAFSIDKAVMTNSEREKQSNLEFVEQAKGDVLIAGLGIGLILLPIQNKKEVNRIDVVEKYQEVIDLVAEQLPLNHKVNIINDDIYKFQPEIKYDTIYFDTFPTTPASLLNEFRESYLNSNGYCKQFNYI